MDYRNFDLLFERSSSGYRARVLESPAGQVAADFTLSGSELPLEGVGRSAQAMKDVGGRLFEAVFANEVRACLRSSLDAVAREGGGLRIRLRMTDVPELSILPWEMLYDAARSRFLALSVDTPVVRYLDLAEPPRLLVLDLPIHMLAVLSSPGDQPPLDLSRAWDELKQAVSGLEAKRQLALERLEKPTLAVLQRKLRESTVHMLHFLGHGAFDPGTGDGTLVFESEDGESDGVSARYLGVLLHDHRPLRLAVLNACEGAKASATDPFAGTAQTLVQAGVPAVVAMQFEIGDQAARLLTEEFYGAVADGYPVDAALAEARKAIYTQGYQTEWATPVLHMRAPDGILWEANQGQEPDVKDEKDKPWWAELAASRGGDVIIGEVGAGARTVAVGKDITQTIHTGGEPPRDERKILEDRLAAVNAALQRSRGEVDATVVSMAEFQLKLLQGELTKTGASEVPSGSTITQVGDWLLDHVPALVEPLKELFNTPEAAKVVGKAGDSAVGWVQRRFGK